MSSSPPDPQDLMIILNLARRQALFRLIVTITADMRQELEHVFEPPDAAPTTPIAPLFVSPSATSPTGSTIHEAVPAAPPSNPSSKRAALAPAIRQLQKDALAFFDGWRGDLLPRLKALLSGPEPGRRPRLRPEPSNAAAESSDADATAAAAAAAAADLSTLHTLYPPTATRLATLPSADRRLVLRALLLFVLAAGTYAAHARVLLLRLTSSLDLPLVVLAAAERETACALLAGAAAATGDSEAAEAERAARGAAAASTRAWKVGVAAVAGAALVGVTGGLAAPLVAGAIGGVMGGVGLGGLAGVLGVVAGNGALMGALFGVLGGKMSRERMDAYVREVDDFAFVPLGKRHDDEEELLGGADEDGVASQRLRVVMGISGWLESEHDIQQPWTDLLDADNTDAFALRYEVAALLDLGRSLRTVVASYAVRAVELEILRRTVLATLWSALWPVWLLNTARIVDNPFALALARSDHAGVVLADALAHHTHGARPVVLLGVSLGARVVYACLRELAARRAFGLIESAVLVGAPVPADTAAWVAMRAVVAGRLINVWSARDYLLAFAYRATSLQYGVAGLQAINGVAGVTNLDVSAAVGGHLRYPAVLGPILRRAGVIEVRAGSVAMEVDVATAAAAETTESTAGRERWEGDPDAREVSREALDSQMNLLGDLDGTATTTTTMAVTTARAVVAGERGGGSTDLLEMLAPMEDIRPDEEKEERKKENNDTLPALRGTQAEETRQAGKATPPEEPSSGPQTEPQKPDDPLANAANETAAPHRADARIGTTERSSGRNELGCLDQRLAGVHVGTERAGSKAAVADDDDDDDGDDDDHEDENDEEDDTPRGILLVDNDESQLLDRLMEAH